MLTLHNVLPNLTQVSLGYRSQQTEQLEKGHQISVLQCQSTDSSNFITSKKDKWSSSNALASENWP